LILLTLAVAGVKRLAASVWFCLCVCPHDKTNYNHRTCYRDSLSRVLAHQLIFGQKVKGQGHRVTKCKKAIKWPAWVMHTIECPTFV